MRDYFAAFVALVTLYAGASAAEEQTLGKVDFATSCSEAAQEEFNRAVALLHHMTYPEAKATFERVADIDPQCAMAHWGIAMTLFQPLWPTRPGQEDLQEGWEAVQRAKALGPPTERERLFVESVEAFFREPQSADYWERIRRWVRGMENLHRAFPDDPEVAAFHALALLALAQSQGGSLDLHESASEILLSIYERNPVHPGAIHYLIHANDVQGRERESLDIVRGYGKLAPRNPHALHMPTHIFTRLGNWDEVIAGNIKAAEAALEHPAGDKGQYVWDEFPHAIEYQIYAHLQRGADESAAALLDTLQSTDRLHPTFKTAFHLSSTPARYVLERRAWAAAAELVPRPYAALDWDRFPWPEAVTWFARGLGAAHTGRGEDGQRAQSRLAELEAAANRSGEEVFTRQIRVLRLALSAWLHQIEGESREAREQMLAAADLEVATPKHPVTPAPTLPAHELLGDLLMEQKRADEALAAYGRSLELYPRRFNSTLGAARAARELKRQPEARRYYRQLLEISAPDSSRPGVSEARSYVSPRR